MVDRGPRISVPLVEEEQKLLVLYAMTHLVEPRIRRADTNSKLDTGQRHQE